MTQQENTFFRVDPMRLLRALWRRAWIVVLAMILCGALVFSGTYLFVTPEYEASAMLYVNNSSISVGSDIFTISSSDLTAAQKLVQTYLVILNSRSTLETVAREAQVSYSSDSLKKMLSAESVNGTEIFQVTVTSHDPKEAEIIANAVATVLPGRIASVVDGSSVRVVDYAVSPSERSSPSYGLSLLLGVGLGAVVSIFILALMEAFSTTVRSEEYLTRHYGDIPLLAVIPDAKSRSRAHYRKQAGKTGGKS